MTTHQDTQTTDIAATFAAAASQLLRVTDALTPDQATLRTGSTDFDVAALSGHLLAVFERVQHTLRTGSYEGSPSQGPAAPGADLREAYERTAAVLADPGLLARTVTVPWGEVPAAAAVLSWADELVVHTWDLCLAVGGLDDLDPALAEAALPRYRVKLPEGARPDWMPFADEVPVGSHASPYERLVAFTGRDPYAR